MKFLSCWLILTGFLLSLTVQAQVGEIIKKSSERSSGGERNGSSGGSGIYLDVFIYSFSMIEDWQRHTLQKREIIPHITSLDILLQTAVQPASYYIVNPRIRANWGLFST